MLDYVILDMKFANVFLPSFYEINLIKIRNNQVVDRLDLLINPDCDFDKGLIRKYNISNEEIDLAKKSDHLIFKWIEIYDFIEEENIFMFNANSKIEALIERLYVDQLNLPNFYFADLLSLSKLNWKGMDLDNYEDVVKQISFKEEEYRIDTIRNITETIFNNLKVSDIDELKKDFKFSSGYIYKGEKYLVSRMKDWEVKWYEEKIFKRKARINTSYGS